MNSPRLTDSTRPGNNVLAAPVPCPVAAETAADLAGARVAVLGCGSVGGLAAWALASAGVDNLELADRDRLEGANLRRHVCGGSDLGRPKAEAVAGFLRARFPRVTATPHDICFLECPDQLREMLGRSDAVLAATDDEAPKYLIDSMAREIGHPVVYAGVYGGGWGAEVVLTDPADGTPCYGCAARALGRTGVPVSPAATGADYARQDPRTPPSAWVRADLAAILPCAALAARLVTAVLSDQRGAGATRREFQAAGASAWRLALRRVPAWGFGPWEVRPALVERLSDCPECCHRQGSPADLVRLLGGGWP